MKQVTLLCIVVILCIGGSVRVGADDESRVLTARLQPRNEVPAVSSPARGTFSALLHQNGESLEYELSYDELQAPVTQAHIHFAQPNVNGGIMVWLCGTETNPGPAGTQPCPQSGTISGNVTAADVLAITPQGIAAGEFDEFVRALLRGLAYANVHTMQSPTGEIRGQIRVVKRTSEEKPLEAEP